MKKRLLIILLVLSLAAALALPGYATVFEENAAPTINVSPTPAPTINTGDNTPAPTTVTDVTPTPAGGSATAVQSGATPAPTINTGGSPSPTLTKEPVPAEMSSGPAPLSNWSGKWSNILGYITDPVVSASIDDASVTLDIPKDTIAAELGYMYYSIMPAVEIDGNRLIVYDEYQPVSSSDDSLTMTGTAVYDMEYAPYDDGNYYKDWYFFKAVDTPDAGFTDFTYLFISKITDDMPESFATEFYLTYGADPVALVENYVWYPTMLQAGSDPAKVSNNLYEFVMLHNLDGSASAYFKEHYPEINAASVG